MPTLERPRYFIGEERVGRIMQLVCDISREDLRTSRVLDLGCNDGGFSLELARRGAREVVGIEGRAGNVANGIAALEAEGLSQVEFVVDDVRLLSREVRGEFDIVLCLGLLYHLDAGDLFDFVRRVASVCRGYVLIETNVALAPRETAGSNGHAYRGLWYPEDTARPGASLDNPRSFWPTKASLINLLADVGFTSISEVLYPVVPELAPYQDHVVLLAFKGERVDGLRETRWPERLPKLAAPRQSIRYRVRDRLARLHGRGFPSLFG